jgi:uncharacterized protein
VSETKEAFRLPPGTKLREMVPFALMPDGTSATFPLIVIKGIKHGPTVALTGGIHGDEYEGPTALWQLAEEINPSELAGRVLIVPVANLAAFAAGTRTSPVDGQNLARIFPGDPGGTLSFRLAHALFERVVAGADVLVDCHSGGVRLAFAEVAGFYAPGDGIGAATAAASRHLACIMGLEHIWRLPARPGVLSYEAARRGIAVSGGEIGGRGGLLVAEAEGYRAGILRILKAKGMIACAPEPRTTQYPVYLEGDWEPATVGGFVKNHVAIGDRVEEGRLLATIHSPLGDVLTVMKATFPGFVMGVRHLRTIHAGEWATCVVREVAF